MVEDHVNQHYDTIMFSPDFLDLYDGSLMNNVGYRTDPATPQSEASRALIRRLLAYAPDSPEAILDVACGLGGSTLMLADAYGEDKVVAINISEKQLAKCREVAPRVTFTKMSATQMDFADESFDLVLCVEAAFHFRTRTQFFHEAHRVLKPGGRLVLSDMLFRRTAQFRLRATNPAENYIKDIDAYQAQLKAAGFASTEVVDATEECWDQFHSYMWRRERERKGANKFLRLFKLGTNILPRRAVTHVVLAWAEKENAVA